MSEAGPAGPRGPIGKQATAPQAWHNLTRALGRDFPRELRRLEASRRRIARMGRKR